MSLQAFITCSRKGDWRNSRQADKNGLVQVRGDNIPSN